MSNKIQPIIPRTQENVLIRDLDEKDIPLIVSSFKSIGWDKSSELFMQYLDDVQKNTREIWVAFIDEFFAGYITLSFFSLYKPFRDKNIPEIMDLNVLPAFRNNGIGSLLIHTAEIKASTQSNIVGIGVGLYAGTDGGYGAAQRLYVKLGYIPNGKGVAYQYKNAIPGDYYKLDDDLVLWLTKTLSS